MMRSSMKTVAFVVSIAHGVHINQEPSLEAAMLGGPMEAEASDFDDEYIQEEVDEKAQLKRRIEVDRELLALKMAELGLTEKKMDLVERLTEEDKEVSQGAVADAGQAVGFGYGMSGTPEKDVVGLGDEGDTYWEDDESSWEDKLAKVNGTNASSAADANVSTSDVAAAAIAAADASTEAPDGAGSAAEGAADGAGSAAEGAADGAGSAAEGAADEAPLQENDGSPAASAAAGLLDSAKATAAEAKKEGKKADKDNKAAKTNTAAKTQ